MTCYRFMVCKIEKPIALEVLEASCIVEIILCCGRTVSVLFYVSINSGNGAEDRPESRINTRIRTPWIT